MSAVDDIAAYLAHLKTGGNRIDQIIFDELPNGEGMTATDELRRLLDERGVEWSGTIFTEPTNGHPTNTSLGSEHHDAVFIEYHDGNVLRLFDLAPEQAIEATLGKGTCEMEYVPDWMGWHCKSCDNLRQGLRDQKPRYCPDCGAKVVDA